MGNLQPFNDGNPYFMGPYKPLRTWVDEFIPYYMEIMGVDRPDRTHHPKLKDLCEAATSPASPPSPTKAIPL